MKSFKQYISEEKQKSVVFTFGRMNPPTIGHEKLLDALTKEAKKNGADVKVYLSQSNDPKKNPLSYKDKIKFARKMFPKHSRNIMMDTSVKNVFDILVKLYDEGYKTATMVVGSDRVKEFQIIGNKYNGMKARHGFYEFDGGVKIVSAGDRDPDAEGASGMSASKMREAAAADDFTTFVKGVPNSYDGKELFNAVRKGMGLKESTVSYISIELEKVSDIREKYVRGEIFQEGTNVTYNDKIYQVKFGGSNYLIIENDENKKRVWLEDVKENK